MPFGECEWSKKIFKKITDLWANADSFKEEFGYSRIEYLQIWGVARSFFAKRICDQKNQLVLCCNKPGSKTYFDFPTKKQIETTCSPKPDKEPGDELGEVTYIQGNN